MMEWASDLLLMGVPWLLGLSGGGSSESGTSTQTETQTQRRGLLGPQRASLGAALEPEFREFTIPYLESQILGKPITRVTTVPGTPSTLRTLSAGESPTYVMSTAGVRQRAPEGVTGSSRDALGAPYSYADELGTIWTVDPSSGPRTTGTAATPESTKTETVGYESPFTFPGIDERGLYSGQVSAMDRINAMALSRLGVTPGDMTGTRESQLANIAPQLFDLVGSQTLKQKTIPRDIEHGRIEDLVNALHLSAGLLGGSSRGAATGSSLRSASESKFGFNPSPQLVQAAMMAAMG